MSQKFYSLKRILSKDAQYYMVIGERSNGKTFAALEYGLKHYLKTGGKMAIIRRFREDFLSNRGASMFSGIMAAGVLKKLTDKYTVIHYWNRKWYLGNVDEKTGKIIYDTQNPFAYSFSLTAAEHDKSSSYPDIETIIFDEFLSRKGYLNDEFVIFCNVLSTLIRHKDNVKIFMLANTVNQWSPYFTEMGLKNIDKMKQGSIDVYTYGNSGLKVAVEYCASIGESKASNIYFAFNNPRLQMIKTGAWELDLYPHLPYKYKPKDIMFSYFIKFEDTILQAEIIQIENNIFTYIHRKTTPIQDESMDVVFTLEHDPRPNFYYSLYTPVDEISRKIIKFFVTMKVFYQDNELGEIVNNYMGICKAEALK